MRRQVHPVDRVPPFRGLVVFGLQHLLIMYAGAVAVPLILGPTIGLSSRDIAILVNADLLVSGIATIIQSAGMTRLFGVRLPVVAGATFTVLNPMIIIANQYGGVRGLPYVYGAILVSSSASSSPSRSRWCFGSSRLSWQQPSSASSAYRWPARTSH
jgi:uric acid transporter